jgi:predicted ATPase/DNA-binding SARP family transcriptional activator
VRIRLLGGVEAVAGDGTPVDVGPAKCQALLAALALSTGTVVPVTRLVELVWGEDPPRTAARTLQSYVTQLRRSLGADAIVRTEAAYRLAVPVDAVDVLRFQRLADTGDLAAALAEWTGFPLAGLEVPGLAATVHGLVERWLAVVEADLERRVDQDAPAAIGTLTELTAAYPFREGLWALLMTALYRVGRQTDALAAYRTARQSLVEHLGVEPGPRLTELERLVLSQDEQLLARDGHQGNLPWRPGRLFGRDADLELVDKALAAYPVVTLVGPGGIGKSRLAMAAARRVAVDDGAWLVDLTEITAAADVARAVAGPLDIKESGGRDLCQSIVSALRSRRALLVLDNCEHVVDGAATLAEAVAEGCPGVRVLATSREGLGLRDGHERLVTVTPLATEPAVELFTERATAVSSTYDPEAGRAAVEEICRRLDGVPLAIELAAARTTSLATADLLARLDDHLRLLVGGRRTAAERHRTLRATITWSHDLISTPQRRLFHRLSVFAGPFDLTAAETVGAGVAPDVAAVLDELVRRSMVVVEPGPRFRLLETMRQFAAEHVTDSDSLAERHARWCLDQVTHLPLTGPAEVDGTARLDELWPNVRAAVTWAITHDRRLAHDLVRPIVAEIALRNRSELGDWVERLLAVTPPDDTESVVFCLSWAAQRYKLSQDPSPYERLVGHMPDHPLLRHAWAAVHNDWAALAECAGPAAAELRRRGEADLAKLADLDKGAALLFLGRFAEHDAVVTALAEQYRAEGPPTLLHYALMLLGYSAAAQNRPADATTMFDEAVAVRVPDRTHSPNRTIQARAVFRRGERSRALRMLRTHIEDLLDTGNLQAVCYASVEFVNMMTTLDRLPDAAHLLRYLDITPHLDATVLSTEVADARNTITRHPPPPTEQPIRDDRQALEYMRRTLLALG